MTQATLDYNGGLVLYLPPGQTDGFLRGSFYKLSLRRYAAGTENGRIVFKSALNYLDYKKIISLFRQNAERNDLTLSVSPALAAFIESQEIYVEERSRLGMEIKNQDAKLRDRFDIYRQAVDAAMVRRLRPRQMWDSFFMCAMRKSANFSVPGSGKTASVLGMYAYLKLKELVKRIVVVCPKNAFGSWIDEFTACFGDREPLRLLNIHAPTYKTTADRRRALLYDAGPCNLILVNYESVGGVLDALKKLTATDALLVFDEVHKVKRVDGEYARSCLDLARTAGYTVAMTGTPIWTSITFCICCSPTNTIPSSIFLPPCSGGQMLLMCRKLTTSCSRFSAAPPKSSLACLRPMRTPFFKWRPARTRTVY